jgi:hypothetical protein
MDQKEIDQANKLIQFLSSKVGDLTAENAFLKIKLDTAEEEANKEAEAQTDPEPDVVKGESLTSE